MGFERNLYLFSLYNKDLDCRRAVKDITGTTLESTAIVDVELRYKNRFQCAGFYKSSNAVTSTLNFIVTSGMHEQLNFQISEVPGNCSGIVLHSVEKFMEYMPHADTFSESVKFAIDICKRFRYAVLFVTGTSQEAKNVLVEKFGFKVLIDDLVNIHSNRKNYYAAKFITDFELEPIVEPAPVAVPEPVVAKPRKPRVKKAPVTLEVNNA